MSGGGISSIPSAFGINQGSTTSVPPPPPPPPAMTGSTYNQNLQSGMTDAQMRSANPQYSNNQWNDIVTQAGMSSPTGRPLSGSAQFYQPVYQTQYQDYGMTNPFSVSQYGQQPQMQTPFSMFGGQMQGGGYGQYGTNNPYSPYSNTFLNMPSNMQAYTADQKADVYRDSMSRGFNDQQIRNQATGLYGPQSNQAWGWLQGLSMGMTPGLAQGTMQDKVNFYNQAQGQGYNDQVIRNAANQMIGQQSQGDWAYLQGQAAPQMQSPFRSSGPSQAIVSRSAGMRGTPNVIRRAEGGIADLVSE